MTTLETIVTVGGLAGLVGFYLHYKNLERVARNAGRENNLIEIAELTRKIQEGTGDLSRWNEIRKEKLERYNRTKPESTDDQPK